MKPYKTKTKRISRELLFQTAMVLGILAVIMFLVNSKANAQNGSFGDTYIENDEELAVFGKHNFSTGTGAFPGIVGTERDATPGYLSFTPTSTWGGASNTAHADGYVKTYHTTAFVFPIGDNGSYRPAAIGGAANSTAAYYGVNPSTAITTRIDGTNFGALPGGSTFSTTAKASDVVSVSATEYWDINGTTATNITLTWDANSLVSTLTSSNLNALTILGWNGSQWELVASTVDANALTQDTSALLFTGSASSLTAGSITTDATVTPNTYQVYTLGSKEVETCLAAKAYLQGALYHSSNTTMTDDLRVKGLIPTSEPYAALTNFTHVGNGGGETTTSTILATTGNDAIVDWVFIELRDTANSATVIETQAALIQRDGNIVNATDGTSNVCFSAALSDSVFVAIRHRNHLGVMAASPVKLTAAGTTLDFSTITLYGSNAAGYGIKSTSAANTVIGLWPGNTNANTTIIYDNSSSDKDNVSTDVIGATGNTFGVLGYTYSNVYLNTDVDMNGNVIYNNTTSDLDPIANTVLNYPANIFGFLGYNSLTEQLP
jgi:hypothetical protein